MDNQQRIAKLLQAAESIKNGDFPVSFPADDVNDDITKLRQVLLDLGVVLQQRSEAARLLMHITERINSGRILNEVLNFTYEELETILPYDRLGFSLLENDGESVVSVWSRFDGAQILLEDGYSAPLEGSSLKHIIEHGEPRIINDLPQYLTEHPNSLSTKLIVDEGICSSLTCPLWAKGKPIGFLFFSSREKNTYANVHVGLFQQIAGQFAIIAEKSTIYQRLLELDDLKNKFLGIAAHDLRSPLTVIKGNLDLLYDGLLGEVNDTQKESLNKTKIYCQSMLSLINDFLSISAIESGKLELSKQEVNIKTFLENSYAFNKLLAKSKNIELHLDLAGDLPETICIDSARINQVINNLISNAIKFSSPGGQIHLKVEKAPGHIRFSVIDQGPGIPEDETPKLFQFFSKTSVVPTKGEHTSGLGLAIVKRLVEEHNGTVLVESQVNVGTTFSFSLPVS